MRCEEIAEIISKNCKLREKIDFDHNLLIRDNSIDRLYVHKLLEYPFTSKTEAHECFVNYIQPKKLIEFLSTLQLIDDSEIPLESPFTIRATKVIKDVVEKAEESQMARFEDFESESSSGEESDDRVFDGDIIVSDQDLWIKNKKILENATFTIVRGRIYGLVGKNGIGKSTLLRAIRKRRFGISKGLHMYLVKQEDKLTSQSVIDFVLDNNYEDYEQINLATNILRDVGFDTSSQFAQNTPFSDNFSAKTDSNQIELSGNFKDTNNLKDFPRVCQNYPINDAVDFPRESQSDIPQNLKISHIKSNQGHKKQDIYLQSSKFIDTYQSHVNNDLRNFSKNDFNRSFTKTEMNNKKKFSKICINEKLTNLSGGWRVRASLAKAIHKSPQLLLLDEPTNMLDFPTIVWLEKAVQKLNTTVIIVSHDREFLNNVCTDILHLSDLKITPYKGNYDSFVHHRALSLDNQQKEYIKQQEYRKHLQEFVDKFRYNSKRASLAQSKIKILENMVLIEPVKKEVQIKFKFNYSQAKGVLIELKTACVGYITETGSQKPILSNLDFKIAHTSRVVIVGPNGAGKSTLLRLLSKKLEVFSGTVIYNPNIRPAYFTQHHIDQLDPNQSVLEFFHKKSKLKDDQMRKAMSKFNLLADIQKIGTLSGGQKSRLAFSIMSSTEPNMLILDEPTNHLDMESIDALAECLATFEGAVIAVSHDLRFIEKVFTEVWVCDKGTLQFYKGSIRDYKNTLCAQ